MKKILAILVFASALIGCTTTSDYGNFANHEQKNFYLHIQHISDDSVAKLENIFPPAHTKLQLIPISNDPKKAEGDVFGALLAKGLRSKGYSTLEKQDQRNEDFYPVSYVIKNGKDKDIRTYEVILHVGKYCLARLYQVSKTGDLEPLSNWTLRS